MSEMMRVVLRISVPVDSDITEEAMDEIAEGFRQQVESSGDARDVDLDDFYLLGNPEVIR